MDPRRALLALLLVNVVIQTGSAVGKGSVPRPSRFVAIGLVFTVLSVVAEFGEGAQRLAVSFGALVTLGVALGNVASIKGWQIGTAPAEVEPGSVAVGQAANFLINGNGKGGGRNSGGKQRKPGGGSLVK